ncbi:hypothetical protein GE061_003376 [Apolygus lucorum]|uniref:C2H2-type domain-containing protein n=1 Tax=Apolygus lucorum TaxID=248454 RepID=A0A8S9X3M6_APOLU|nr:hypothetical protein GE061_003376 [Apolygus lucorum]
MIFFVRVEFFRCEGCGKAYRHEKNLNLHRKTNVLVRQLSRAPLLEIGATAFQKTPQKAVPNLKYQRTKIMKTTWNNLGNFRCDKCFKFYKYKSNLHRHVKMECGKEPGFFCPHCSYKSYQKGHVVTHVFSKHPDKVAKH